MRYFVFVICSISFTGCLCPPVHEKVPDYSLKSSWKQAVPESTVAKNASTDTWWEVFDDPQLNALIELGLENSPTITQALARFDQAIYIAKVTGADQFPSISLNGYGSRRRIPKDVRPSSNVLTGDYEVTKLPPPVPVPNTGPNPIMVPPVVVPAVPKTKEVSGPKFINNFIATLLVTYELDFWGKYYLQAQAAQNRAQASFEQLETAKLLLVDQIASTYFTLQAIEQELQLLKDEIGAHSERVDLLAEQTEKGLTDAIRVLDEGALLEVKKIEEQSLINSKQALSSLLAVLIGKDPNAAHIPLAPISWSFPIVPTDLPCALLEKRPDVRSRLREVEAIIAEIGAAKTEILPSLSLSGAVGYQASKANEWFKWKDRIWSIAASLAQTVFDAGKRFAQIDATKAQFREAVGNATEAVLSSVKEVEDALSAINTQTIRRQASLQKAEERDITEMLRSKQCEEGLFDYLLVLQAKETAIQAKRELVQEELNLQLATLTLMKSIGGSWTLPQPSAC